MTERDEKKGGSQKLIRLSAAKEEIRLTLHAQQEMVEEDINLEDLLAALTRGIILEEYPEHPEVLAACYLGQATRGVLCTLFARQRSR